MRSSTISTTKKHNFYRQKNIVKKHSFVQPRTEFPGWRNSTPDKTPSLLIRTNDSWRKCLITLPGPPTDCEAPRRTTAGVSASPTNLFKPPRHTHPPWRQEAPKSSEDAGFNQDAQAKHAACQAEQRRPLPPPLPPPRGSDVSGIQICHRVCSALSFVDLHDEPPELLARAGRRGGAVLRARPARMSRRRQRRSPGSAAVPLRELGRRACPTVDSSGRPAPRMQRRPWTAAAPGPCRAHPVFACIHIGAAVVLHHRQFTPPHCRQCSGEHVLACYLSAYSSCGSLGCFSRSPGNRVLLSRFLFQAGGFRWLLPSIFSEILTEFSSCTVSVREVARVERTRMRPS
jgi:hypothetical protein